MDIKKIQELIRLVEKNKYISELSIEEKAFKFHVKKNSSETKVVSFDPPPLNKTPVVVNTAVPKSQPSSPPPPSSQKKYIKSPIVGTFYSRTSPDSPVYVKVGDVVQPETVVCIIESMKVFNEVEAEISGTIKKVLLKDGTPVEYRQPLFIIE